MNGLKFWEEVVFNTRNRYVDFGSDVEWCIGIVKKHSQKQTYDYSAKSVIKLESSVCHTHTTFEKSR